MSADDASIVRPLFDLNQIKMCYYLYLLYDVYKWNLIGFCYGWSRMEDVYKTVLCNTLLNLGLCDKK